ncbi:MULTISPECIES: Mu-like prophage major head subunit gpT family protein [Halomonas]|uniref:Head protein n=1 Tax=Halomonas halophila TaxID=29573 RepID=A0ABQ0U1M8_9GAMM|nr:MULTISPECIES: Mu-like prophage major head subunit gpT family protein [Halomonas]MDR5889638.1 Mu-like prophage major head subunit gpT family protein [Halomonas salina]WJY06320.1 Mu-like prophage major head subunit gpT family protein [Halomonas halophila]GEK71593.1 head protein [Halomonas halophila]
MNLTSANLQALYKAYKTNFQQGFNSLGEQGALYELFCTTVPSTTAVEVYPWLKSLPRMREWLGDRVIHGLESSDFSIRNRKFELTAGVPRDAIEDDTYGVYGPTFQEFGRSSREHPNELAVEVLEANPLCYDGQNLFDTDHPVLDASGAETSVSNDMGGSGPAWYVMDLSRAIKPMVFQRRRDYDFRALTDLMSDRVFMTDDFMFGTDARVNAGPGLWQLVVRSHQEFNAANYKAARQRLTTLTGDHGRPLGLRHTHTMVPNHLEGEARVILMNQNDAAGATNPWQNTSQLILNPWLASA